MTKYYYYQVSDNVPSKIIRTATESCKSEDCQISARFNETTCAGVTNYYNKEGSMQIEDNNRFTVELCCGKCYRGWTVDQNGNILDEFTPEGYGVTDV